MTPTLTLADELMVLAGKATPQRLERAQTHDLNEPVDCPLCDGEGVVEVETYANYDDVAIGVQFFGVGDEHVAAHELYKLATPTNITALCLAVKELSDERDIICWRS